MSELMQWQHLSGPQLQLDAIVSFIMEEMYRQTSNISNTLIGCKLVDHSDVVGASPVGAAPTTSSFST